MPSLHGMSLRDWFAGQALGTTWNVSEMRNLEPAELRVALAKCCYALADAMIAEREREK